MYFRRMLQMGALAASCFGISAHAAWYVVAEQADGNNKCLALKPGSTPEDQIAGLCKKEKCPIERFQQGKDSFRVVTFPNGEKAFFSDNPDACRRLGGALGEIRAYAPNQGEQKDNRSPQMTIQRTEQFTPFTLVSTKLKKELPSSEIESKLMCRDQTHALADATFLINNFDVVRTGGDHSMGLVVFRGKQQDKFVEVTLGTSHPSHLLQYVWVNSDLVLTCK